MCKGFEAEQSRPFAVSFLQGHRASHRPLFITPWTVGDTLLFRGRSALPMCVLIAFGICLLEASHSSMQFGSFQKV